jgi:hypothetical protein
MKGTFSRRMGEQVKIAKDSAVEARTQAISQLRKARGLPGGPGANEPTLWAKTSSGLVGRRVRHLPGRHQPARLANDSTSMIWT